MVNEDHVREFVTLLRTTTTPQATGALCKVADDGETLAYCCLGLGSVHAGVPMEHRDHPEAGLVAAWFGEAQVDNLAPYEFIEWLGFEVDSEAQEEGWDLELGVPPEIAELELQGPEEGWHPSQAYVHYIGIPSLANLNDGGFTFAQIGDMIAYFGLQTYIN